LTSIIESRKKLKLSTFCPLIDFKKAYDFINRQKLWQRLTDIGMGGKLLMSIKSLYSSISSCIRVNSLHTDWFEAKCGLRQGCILSPLLFNLYLNDLAVYLKSTGIGIVCGADTICMLMYADDLVILASTEQELQLLLNALNDWCNRYSMTVNSTKSNIVHFRNPAVNKTDFQFKGGDIALSVVEKYTYLGILLTEHLDFNITAKHVAQSASRALGLLISKCKLVGGVPYNVFTKLYDSIVWPVISYCAGIWGIKQYSCIDAVQNRAMRFFLGVGKYTPNAAVIGEMGWEPAYLKQWVCVGRQFTRLSITNSTRLNKRIAIWANDIAGPSCRNWFFNMHNILEDLHIDSGYDISRPIPRLFLDQLQASAHDTFVESWSRQVNSINGPSNRGRNKLRTYSLFKTQFETEAYCQLILPLRHRSAFAKFRCGVAPLRIETGRYENLSLDDRKCPFCSRIETEAHVLLDCALYDDFRIDLYERACVINSDFTSFSAENKLVFLFSNQDLIRHCAKTCFNILKRRNFYLCK